MIARFIYNGRPGYGLLKDGKIRIADDVSLFEDKIRLTGLAVSLDEARLLAPVSPTKIVCVGLNYKKHAKELGMPMPAEPIIFLKPPSSVIGPGDDILYPDQPQRLDYEAELAVVIRKRCSRIPAREAKDFILGFTCLNDVTARDLQKRDGQWTRAKSFDTFCPLGPWISTDISPEGLVINSMVNSELKQNSNTDDMIFPVAFLIEFISHVMTLMPGDVIATGTPEGVGPLSRGDEVQVSIKGIGTLSNRVV